MGLARRSSRRRGWILHQLIIIRFIENVYGSWFEEEPKVKLLLRFFIFCLSLFSFGLRLPRGLGTVVYIPRDVVFIDVANGGFSFVKKPLNAIADVLSGSTLVSMYLPDLCLVDLQASHLRFRPVTYRRGTCAAMPAKPGGTPTSHYTPCKVVRYVLSPKPSMYESQESKYYPAKVPACLTSSSPRSSFFFFCLLTIGS